MNECKVEGCHKPVKVKALCLCSGHYQSLKAQGLLPSIKPHGPLEQRFWWKVKKTDSCWEWTGGKNEKGYGHIQRGGRGSEHLLVHRYSYELHNGPIPEGLFVLHSCDNPSCVNPSHLRIGTQSENILEAYQKGRKVNPIRRGEDHKRSKLTQEMVAFIRANESMQHVELAKILGVSPNCVRGVRIGRTWKNHAHSRH